MADKAMSSDVEVVDVLGPMLKSIEKSTGLLPKNQAGLIHSLDHEYLSVLRLWNLLLNTMTVKILWVC